MIHVCVNDLRASPGYWQGVGSFQPLKENSELSGIHIQRLSQFIFAMPDRLSILRLEAPGHLGPVPSTGFPVGWKELHIPNQQTAILYAEMIFALDYLNSGQLIRSSLEDHHRKDDARRRVYRD